jgi:hypothetical protein
MIYERISSRTVPSPATRDETGTPNTIPVLRFRERGILHTSRFIHNEAESILHAAIVSIRLVAHVKFFDGVPVLLSDATSGPLPRLRDQERGCLGWTN